MKTKNKIVLLLTLLSVCLSTRAQITWPEGQLLPSFPEPATTQDLIYLRMDDHPFPIKVTTEEMYLFSSLKGIINMTQPRIFSYEGDDFAEGPYTWLNSLGIKYTEHGNIPWNVLQKYLSEIEGLIVYDPNQDHTVNLATTLAKDKKALIAAPSLLPMLTAAPYNLPILEDLRDRYTNKLEIYQDLFDNYWLDIDKRILIGLSPDRHKGSLREYAVALGAAVIWLDPDVAIESALLNKFLESMPPEANYMGWWPEEGPGVDRASRYGIATIASDYSTNLTFHSGMPRTIKPRPMPAKPDLENKIYVAFILSDGDNLQYVEHLMRKLWNNSDRGRVPIGWTISPAMVDAMPGALNYYHSSARDGDNLISGPSGYGYTYPNHWPSTNSYAALKQFVKKTEEYNIQAGIRVATIWNTITGGIGTRSGIIFADNASTLLGMTGQNTGAPLVVYNNSLPGMPLSCNYCTGEEAMKDHIASAARGWNGRNPRFVIIQAQPWNNVTPTSFKNVANSLDANDYVVVRPDHIFQLIREANGLAINPGGVEGDGTGLTATYYNGKNFEEEVITQSEENNLNFNWGTDSPLEGVNANNFSVRWAGKMQPRYSGEYTFYLNSDSVARIWINDELFMEKKATGFQRSEIELDAREKYDILIEYHAGRSNANFKLEWASPFQSREILPPNQLYGSTYIPDDSNLDTNILSGLRVFSSLTADGILNIELSNSKSEDVRITIYDIRGNALLMQVTKESNLQLDVNNLSKGVYLIDISSNSYSKVIKQIIH